MGLKNASKAGSKSTKKKKTTNKATAKITDTHPDKDKENNKENDDSTEPTADSTYLTSEDEDTAAEEETEDNESTMKTRPGNKRKKSGGDKSNGHHDEDQATTIAMLQKQVNALAKQSQQKKAGNAAEIEADAVANGDDEPTNPAIIVRRLTKQEADQQRNSQVAKLVRGATKTHLWRVSKFVKSEEHLDKLTSAAMDILAIPWTSLKGLEKDTYEYNQVLIRRDNFVAIYRDDVRKEINEKRSYTMSQATVNAVEPWMNGEYCGTNEPTQLPTKEEMYKVIMRDLQVNDGGDQRGTEYFNFVFRWYYTVYLPCFALNEMFGAKFHDWGPVSYLMWELDDGTKKLRVPPSTEAFALLAYENCYDKWVNTHEFRQNPENKDAKRPRYEKKKNPDSRIFKGLYSDPNSGQAKFGGWSSEGLERFYQLCKDISKNRKEKKEHVCAMDQLVIDQIQEEQQTNAGGKAPKKAKKSAKSAPKPIEGEDYEEEI